MVIINYVPLFHACLEEGNLYGLLHLTLSENRMYVGYNLLHIWCLMLKRKKCFKKTANVLIFERAALMLKQYQQ